MRWHGPEQTKLRLYVRALLTLQCIRETLSVFQRPYKVFVLVKAKHSFRERVPLLVYLQLRSRVN